MQKWNFGHPAQLRVITSHNQLKNMFLKTEKEEKELRTWTERTDMTKQVSDNNNNEGTSCVLWDKHLECLKTGSDGLGLDD